MRIVIAHAILSVAALLSTLATAWEEDSRCSRRRALDPNKTDTNLGIQKSEQVAAVSPDKNLRGPEANRQLRQLTFMLKMYWEEGYCWQEEWRERKWCLKCEGSKCNEDDHLLLDNCSWNDDEQWFVHESIDADERKIKLKPWTNPDLCWTRTGDSTHTLKPCGNNYVDSTGRDAQVLIGFKESGEFELHPNGRSGDCLVNDHREYTVYRSPRSATLWIKYSLVRLSRIQQTPDGMRSSDHKIAKKPATTERVCGKYTTQKRTMLMTMTTTMMLIFRKSKIRALTTVRRIPLAVYVLATVTMMTIVKTTLFATSVKNTIVFPLVAEVQVTVRDEIIARTLESTTRDVINVLRIPLAVCVLVTVIMYVFYSSLKLDC
jgi:hypothetical protein